MLYQREGSRERGFSTRQDNPRDAHLTQGHWLLQGGFGRVQEDAGVVRAL